MGNGFTFELETLIFYALVRTALELSNVAYDDILVYGDDIIIPSQGYDAVCASLAFFGFTTNKLKSFNEGPFRESCGGDFFKGTNVRPYFLKEVPSEPSRWISFANGLRELFAKFPSDHPFHRDAHLAWIRCLQRIPSSVRRLRGPSELGDIVIHDHPDSWVTKWVDGIRYIRTYQPVHRYRSWSKFKPAVVYACALYGVPNHPRGVLPRDSVSGHRESWSAFS